MKLKLVAVIAGVILAAEIAARKPTPTMSYDGTGEGPQVSDTLSDIAVSEVISDVVDTGKNVVASVQSIFGTKYDALINQSATQYGIPSDVLYRLLFAESHFREDIITGRVRSRTGALGIAQFMPATAIQELGSVDAALDPTIAIPGAARYLAKLIAATGSTTAGVAAYNWGIGNVQRKGVNSAPPETVSYVDQVLGV